MASDETIAALQLVWESVHSNRCTLPDEPEPNSYEAGAAWGLAYAKRRLEIAQEQIIGAEGPVTTCKEEDWHLLATPEEQIQIRQYLLARKMLIRMKKAKELIYYRVRQRKARAEERRIKAEDALENS